MMIRDMFADDINRKINGVIKVDQAADDVIEQELNEYVITRDRYVLLLSKIAMYRKKDAICAW